MSRDTHRPNEEIAKAPNAMLGQEIMSFKKTLSGAAPHAVLFSDHDLPNMADDQYRVFVQGEVTTFPNVDESSIATTGFSLLNGLATEVIHILVHGKIAGRLQP